MERKEIGRGSCGILFVLLHFLAYEQIISKSKWQIILIRKSFNLALLVKYQSHHDSGDASTFFFQQVHLVRICT